MLRTNMEPSWQNRGKSKRDGKKNLINSSMQKPKRTTRWIADYRRASRMFLIRWGKEANGEDGKGKACGPVELSIEAVHIILDYKPECIVKAFYNIIRTNKVPNDWRKNRMVPIFKGKGDVLECNNYSGIKLMSHTLEIWERMIEARLGEITNITDN